MQNNRYQEQQDRRRGVLKGSGQDRSGVSDENVIADMHYNHMQYSPNWKLISFSVYTMQTYIYVQNTYIQIMHLHTYVHSIHAMLTYNHTYVVIYMHDTHVYKYIHK